MKVLQKHSGFNSACQWQLLLSADHLSKQFGPRSGPTEHRSCPESIPFDTLTGFLKQIFENVNFEKKSSEDNKGMKNNPAC